MTYESMTYELLLARMMERVQEVDRKLDTREGSLSWLGSAPAAVELQNLYIALDTVLRETYVLTAGREHLIMRAAERGLAPYPASAAVLELSITPAELPLPLQTRFSIGELNYYVSRRVGAGVYEITCETAGETSSSYGVAVIPIEYVKGLESCAITALLIPGEDEEETEAFRQRVLESFRSQPFRRQPGGLYRQGGGDARRRQRQGASRLERRH